MVLGSAMKEKDWEHLEEVRRLIVEFVREHNTTLASVSRAIGRNHAYLHQFVHRRTPMRLPEVVRHAIAKHLNIDERLLADPALLKSRALQDEADMRASVGTGSGARFMSLAARLSVARAESAFDTLSTFARAANIDRDRYAELEDGVEPTLGELYRIYKVSGKSLEWLIEGAVDATSGMMLSMSEPTAPDAEWPFSLTIDRSRPEPEIRVPVRKRP